MMSKLLLQINGVGRILSCKPLWHLHYYSSNTAASSRNQPQNPDSMVGHLIDSLGFSQTQALSVRKRLSAYKSFKQDPDLVVSFFQGLGLDKTQIKRFISTEPRLLFCSVDKALKPRVQIFQDLGLSGPDLTAFLAYHAYILRRTDCYIRRPIECLRDMLGCDEIVVEVVKRCGRLLDPYAPLAIEPNVALLRKFGWSGDKISKLIVNKPWIILRETKWLEGLLQGVETDFGIPRECKMFYHGVLVYASLKKSTFDEKIENFRSCGWTDTSIRSLVRNLPFTFTLSEANVRKSAGFFMGELGYTDEYLASHPVLLSLSLERRVKPRYEILKILIEKKLISEKVNHYNAFCFNDLKFVNLYLHPYKDEIPEKYESYMSNCRRGMVRRAEN
ncbi:transcription termination factor MTERF15, mitochondrial-like [Coffea arabica]|uniref:Transcription termination factor MTERF15, mitochondrial-like n=1 Tax=Coffea arabica TaxID=13443 RepID=A0A6P6UX65_COFAR